MISTFSGRNNQEFHAKGRPVLPLIAKDCLRPSSTTLSSEKVEECHVVEFDVDHEVPEGSHPDIINSEAKYLRQELLEVRHENQLAPRRTPCKNYMIQ